MERDEFQGRHILIVEDEFLIAEDLEESFAELGAVIVGPAPSIDRALGACLRNSGFWWRRGRESDSDCV
jgi:hypothetical protein